MKEMSKDKKIELLERFLRAVVGRPQSDIKIEYWSYDSLKPVIRLSDCNIEDVMKISSCLEMYDINISFYPYGKVVKNPWEKRRYIEGFTEVEFMFEPLYYEEAEKLRRKLKEKVEQEHRLPEEKKLEP